MKYKVFSKRVFVWQTRFSESKVSHRWVSLGRDVLVQVKPRLRPQELNSAGIFTSSTSFTEENNRRSTNPGRMRSFQQRLTFPAAHRNSPAVITKADKRAKPFVLRGKMIKTPPTRIFCSPHFLSGQKLAHMQSECDQVCVCVCEGQPSAGHETCMSSHWPFDPCTSQRPSPTATSSSITVTCCMTALKHTYSYTHSYQHTHTHYPIKLSRDWNNSQQCLRFAENISFQQNEQ